MIVPFLVSLSSVQVMVREAQQSFRVAEGELERDNPPEALKTFVGEAKPRVDGLAASLDLAKTDFAKCAQLYGEDPKTQSPEEFFTLINTFARSFEQALEQLRKKRQQQEEPPKPARSLITRRAQQQQPTQDENQKGVMSELQNRLANRQSSKVQHNQIEDGDLERIMHSELVWLTFLCDMLVEMMMGIWTEVAYPVAEVIFLLNRALSRKIEILCFVVLMSIK